MRKTSILGPAVAGACGGIVTGLFGAGGGMVLIPLLTLLTDLKEEELFPFSVSTILPLCIVTLLTVSKPMPWQDVLPYLIGSGLGGICAGIWGRKIPVKWLHRILGIFILWGGFRYLC